jgi:Zn-dependent protease with chaperone function
MIEQIIGIILLAIPISIIIYLIIDGLDKFRKSYFKEIKDEEIEELKKRMNVKARIYETNFFSLNGLSIYNIILISEDFVKRGKDYVRGIVAHELAHIKKKHLFKFIPIAIFMIIIIYIDILIPSKTIMIDFLKAIIITIFPFIYLRIEQRFQKEADKIAFDYVGEDVIKPLLLYYKEKENTISKLFSSFLAFFIYFKFDSNLIIGDRISCLNLLLNKGDEKVKGGNEK